MSVNSNNSSGSIKCVTTSLVGKIPQHLWDWFAVNGQCLEKQSMDFETKVVKFYFPSCANTFDVTYQGKILVSYDMTSLSSLFALERIVFGDGDETDHVSKSTYGHFKTQCNNNVKIFYPNGAPHLDFILCPPGHANMYQLSVVFDSITIS